MGAPGSFEKIDTFSMISGDNSSEYLYSKKQYQVSPIKLAILLGSVLIFSAFMEVFVMKIAPKAVDPSANLFSGKRAHQYWKNITVDIPKRYAFTESFNLSYNFILQTLIGFKNRASTKTEFDVSVEEQSGLVGWENNNYQNSIQTEVRNIMFRYGPKGSTTPPLLMSAHIDSKNTGPGAYDDAAGIAAMMEMAELLVESTISPKVPVILLFVGTEELGLDGSRLFVKSNISVSSYLNVESLGPGLPMMLLQKGYGSSETIKAWKKQPGMIIATLIDDVIDAGIVSSTSDSVVYRKKEIPGVEALYIGNPTMYHTRGDSIGPAEHLQLLGNAMIKLIYNIDPKAKQEKMTAIGVSPFVFSMTDGTKEVFAIIFGITMVLICSYSIIKDFAQLKQSLLVLVVYIASYLAAMLISVFIAMILYNYNSLSFACYCVFAVFLLGIIVLSSYFVIHSLIPILQHTIHSLYTANMLFFGLLLLFTYKMDIALILVWLSFFLIVAFLLKKQRVVSLVATILGFVPLMFMWHLLFRTFIQYTGTTPGFMGEMVPWVLIFILLFTITLPLLPFLVHSSEKNEGVRIYVVLSLVIPALFIILKFTSHSQKYNVPGTVAHVFDGSNESVVTFMPVVGSRVINLLHNKVSSSSGIQKSKDFGTLLERSAVLFKVHNSTLPSFIPHWPLIKITNNGTDNGVTSYIFSMPENNPHLHKLIVKVKCPGFKCVESFYGYHNINEFSKGSYQYLFKKIPSQRSNEFVFGMIHKNQEIELEISFSYEKWTNQMNDFVDLLPKYALPYDMNRAIFDTVLFNKTTLRP